MFSHMQHHAVDIFEESYVTQLVQFVVTDRLNGHLLFGINGSMVRTTICNGKVLMKDREVLVCDVDKVMADCRQSAQELADDINGGK